MTVSCNDPEKSDDFMPLEPKPDMKSCLISFFIFIFVVTIAISYILLIKI